MIFHSLLLGTWNRLKDAQDDELKWGEKIHHPCYSLFISINS